MWSWLLLSCSLPCSLRFGVSSSPVDFKLWLLCTSDFSPCAEPQSRSERRWRGGDCAQWRQTLRCPSFQSVPDIFRADALFVPPRLALFCCFCLLVAHLTTGFLLCCCPSSFAFLSYGIGWGINSWCLGARILMQRVGTNHNPCAYFCISNTNHSMVLWFSYLKIWSRKEAMLCDSCCMKLSCVAWSVPLFRLPSRKFLIAPPVINCYRWWNITCNISGNTQGRAGTEGYFTTVAKRCCQNILLLRMNVSRPLCPRLASLIKHSVGDEDKTSSVEV